MVLRTIVIPAALLAALAVAPTPAGAQHRSGHSGGGSRATASPRGGNTPRGVYGGSRGVYGGPRGYYSPRYYGGSRFVGVGRYYAPYYAFRPRFSLGFGLWAGFPVSYPYYYYGYPYGYAYPYPYGYGYYSYPYPYGYPAPGYGYPAPGYGYQTAPQDQSTPSAVATGGVSFEITPNTAEVYVDGSYAGTVAEFSPSSQPLTLSPGRHHIEVRSPNYSTMTFDTDVIAGQVVPYRGTMQPR